MNCDVLDVTINVCNVVAMVRIELRATRQKNKMRFHYTLYVRNVTGRDELRVCKRFCYKKDDALKNDAFLRTVDKDLERGRCL